MQNPTNSKQSGDIVGIRRSGWFTCYKNKNKEIAEELNDRR